MRLEEITIDEPFLVKPIQTFKSAFGLPIYWSFNKYPIKQPINKEAEGWLKMWGWGGGEGESPTHINPGGQQAGKPPQN